MKGPGIEHTQARFIDRVARDGPGALERGTMVVLPSVTFPATELRKIVGIEHYEERLLCMLLMLQSPELNVVFVSSVPVDPAVVDYYLSFLGDPRDARRRLRLVSVNDAEPRALSEKLLDHPGALAVLKACIEDTDGAFIVPFNVTELEEQIASTLGIALYGTPHNLTHLGSKSGGRSVARAAGVPVLPGAEDLYSIEAVDAAVLKLRDERPGLTSVVVKLNNGFSGQGNAIVSVTDDFSSIREAPTVFCAEEESWLSYALKVGAEGAVVEEHVRGDGVVSPSVQARILPGGRYEHLSTHDQILGGPDDQVYLGCRFPADSAYRDEITAMAERVGAELAARGALGSFGVDLIVVPGDRIYLSEINLRLGGTTHPFLMARRVTRGTLDPATGRIVTEAGPRCYVASDNVKSKALAGVRPADVITRLRDAGLLFSPASRSGVTVHLLGALARYGKMGLVALAASPKDADDLYRNALDLLLDPAL